MDGGQPPVGPALRRLRRRRPARRARAHDGGDQPGSAEGQRQELVVAQPTEGARHVAVELDDEAEGTVGREVPQEPQPAADAAPGEHEEHHRAPDVEVGLHQRRREARLVVEREGDARPGVARVEATPRATPGEDAPQAGDTQRDGQPQREAVAGRRGVADALLGQKDISGRLPISIPGLYEIGSGMFKEMKVKVEKIS